MLHRSIARFIPTPFKVLTVGLLASFSVVSAPSGNTIALEAFVCSISTTTEVSIAKLVDIVLASNSRVYNSYNLVWMAPRMICYYCSNVCRASMVTSRTVSPISCKSPSMRVIGSNNVLVTLDFFLDPPFSYSQGCLMQVDVTYGFALCCSICSSISSSVSGKGDLTPLSKPCSVPPVCFSVY